MGSIGTDMDYLNSLTVVELKRLLREKGLTVSGNKSELISRLEVPEEEFLVIDEEERTTTVSKKNPKEISAYRTIEKIETYCPSCRAVLRYPSDYYGNLTCPRCKKKFKVNSSLGISKILSISSIVVFLLTIIITLMVGATSTASGQYGSGMAAAAYFMIGLTLSGVLLGSALISSLAKRLL